MKGFRYGEDDGREVGTCSRESDVLSLVSIGQWPRQADDELTAHVAGCAACAETITVAAALFELDQDDALPALPDARAVWQQAQWQARHDAMQRAARPVVAMQGVAAVGVITAIVAALVWLSASFSLGDRILALGASARASAAAIGTTAVTVADLFTFEVPASVVLLLAGSLALGLTAIGVAVALSTLADLRSDR